MKQIRIKHSILMALLMAAAVLAAAGGVVLATFTGLTFISPLLGLPGVVFFIYAYVLMKNPPDQHTR